MKLLTALLFMLGCVGLQAQTQWALDRAHSNVRFTVSHMTIAEVDGTFDEFNASVIQKGDDFAGSEVSFTIQTASINTGNDRRDGHLKSDDFFNAELYPEINFDGMLKKNGDSYKLVGELTIRDVTKQVEYPVRYYGQIPGRDGSKAGFKVTGTVDRFEYNLNWDNKIQNGSFVVGETVEFTCNIELNEIAS